MRPDTRAVHAGRTPDATTGAVTPPIVLSTTFARDETYETIGSHVYARSANPNREALEEVLCALESGQVAAAFGSGQAATASVFHCLAPGDHVLIADDLYYGTRALLQGHYEHWGLSWSVCDMTSNDAVRAAMRPNTRVVWVETPSNPTLKLADIAAISEIAHAGGAFVVADNTWATPIFTKPLSLGADLVMHSTTKQIGGHSDVLGGALVGASHDERWERIVDHRRLGGAAPSPFDCWLLLRSAPTLPIRARAQAANAARVAEWCATQPSIAAVHYPGLVSHPQHALACRQMTNGYGSMLSIEVRGGATEALAVACAAKLFVRATSLGGVESLIEHRYTVEGADSVASPALLRLSIGLEDPDDLIDDLAQAVTSIVTSSEVRR